MTAYIITEQKDDCCQYWVTIAVFSSQEKARLALEVLKNKNPKADYEIEVYPLDPIVVSGN